MITFSNAFVMRPTFPLLKLLESPVTGRAFSVDNEAGCGLSKR